MTTAQGQQSREMLPCPFCGREAMMSHSRDGEVCNVRCAGWSVCNCLGAGPNCYTEADAVAGWNRRAPGVPAGIKPFSFHYRVKSRDGVERVTFYPHDSDDILESEPVYTAAQVQAMGRVLPEPTSKQIVLMAGAILHRAHGTADTRHPGWAQAVEQAERAYRALVSA